MQDSCAGSPRRLPCVSLGGPLREARFVDRPNRFLVRCRLDGGPVVEAHLPDPGRLEEFLVRDRPLRLRPAEGPGRRTAWTVVLARAPGGEEWVSLDTTLPNRLVGRALEAGVLEELEGWRLREAEVSVGTSRLDFLLEDDGGRLLALEVKSVTRVEGGVGLFPDAVTARGARHVRELAELCRREGREAAVLFVVQRRDAERVRAAPEIDPTFAAALDDAREAGVRALARRCGVDLERVCIGRAVPVM